MNLSIAKDKNKILRKITLPPMTKMVRDRVWILLMSSLLLTILYLRNEVLYLRKEVAAASVFKTNGISQMRKEVAAASVFKTNGISQMNCMGSVPSFMQKGDTFKSIEPAYQEIQGLIKMNCAGSVPFFMQKGDTVDWVCNNHGEKKVTAIMQKVFSSQCKKSTGAPGLMLDVGSNLGYYGLLAMSQGCESLLFDLQPGCQSLINNAIVVNQFTSLGRVVPFGVSDVESSFKVNSKGCDGRFPAAAYERGKFDQGDAVARLYPMSTFLHEDQPILLMKVDTEGNENYVLRGVDNYFSRRLVRHAIVETTPGHGFWSNINVTQEQVAKTFSEIAGYGYIMVSLHDYSVHTSADSVYKYILNAPFLQSDMWFTTDDVDNSVLEEIKK